MIRRKWEFGAFLTLLSVILVFYACKDTSTDSDAPPIPSIISISPTMGPPGIAVTISGSGFAASPSENRVTFNGVLAEVTSASASSLEATVPEEAQSGAVEVAVGGQIAVGPNFTVEVEMPGITAVEPDSGEVGTAVTITGMNFAPTPAENIVTFNGGVIAFVNQSSDTTLDTHVPEGAESGPIQLEVDGEKTLSPSFKVLTPSEELPQITGVEPDSGEVGTQVTITGENFDPMPSGNIVTFNGGVIAAVGQASDSSLATSVPEGAESGPIQVEVDGEKALSPSFEVIKAGALEIVVFTTGQSPDPDGFTVTLDNGEVRALDPNDTVTFKDMDAGDYELELSDVAGNCSVDGANPRLITVKDGEITTTTFNLTCTGIHQIAFVSNRSGNNEVWVVRADGWKLTNLTVHPASDGGPRWSLDGTRIAFGSDRSGNNEIWIMDVDGSNPTNLTNDPGDDIELNWSPDGARIAFVSDRSGNNEVWVMNADGSNPTKLTNDPDLDLNPQWSPDGAQIAFVSNRSGNSDIWIMDADGSNQTNLTSDPAVDTEFSWSPDGTEIAFRSDRTGAPEIWVMDPDGSNPTNLTNDPGFDLNPQWSPDGTRIAFRSTRTGANEIWVMDADGSNQANLTNNLSNDFTPEWSPDGTQIAFQSDRSGDNDIWLMDPDGSNPMNLTNDPGNDVAQQWRPF